MTVSHELSIAVHDLDAAGRAFHLPLRVAWLRGALEGTDVEPSAEDGTLDVRLSKSGTDVVIRGRFDVKVRVACARCLEPAEIPLREPLTALAVVGLPSQDARAEQEPDEDETTADEPDTVRYDGETVVLDDLVRDEILLAIPMIPLCSESCAGISHQPGAEKAEPSAIDPRLQPLLKLKKPE